MLFVQLAAFAFLAGLTACGTAATLCELFAKEHVRFDEPFVSGRHLERSVVVTLAAGPFMLGNDALEAWRSEAISGLALAACAAAAMLWLAAVGIVLLALASGVLGLVA